MKLKYLVIICENCEEYRIPAENVLGLSLADINEKIYTDSENEVYHSKLADYTYLKLKADNYKSTQELEAKYDNAFSFSKRMIVGRDITGLSLVYEDEDLEEEYYGVYYIEEDSTELGSPNKFQKAREIKNENSIIIEIFSPLTE